jgi:hypothetical protein
VTSIFRHPPSSSKKRLCQVLSPVKIAALYLDSDQSPSIEPNLISHHGILSHSVLLSPLITNLYSITHSQSSQAAKKLSHSPIEYLFDYAYYLKRIYKPYTGREKPANGSNPRSLFQLTYACPKTPCRPQNMIAQRKSREEGRKRGETARRPCMYRSTDPV